MKRVLRDVRRTGQSPPPPGLTALIDKEQLARKLEMRAGEVVSHAQQQGFPSPVAYFRGRILWDEAAIDTWLGDQPKVVSHAQQQGFPSPVAYFRGRILWDEAAIDTWLGDQPNDNKGGTAAAPAVHVWTAGRLPIPSVSVNSPRKCLAHCVLRSRTS
jgi:predicted DNA-binding transcriptional regulator AlpA